MAYMKTKSNRHLSLSKWVGLALIAAGGLSACNGYDLAEKDPGWLGSSIYDYLKSDGNYTNVVRLIDDLGYAEVLAKTGSKTLFVADDDAYNRFYQNKTWGVSSYDELSLAQKKLLLYGGMINNASQVAYLSSSEGPTEGDCMRRITSQSMFDSVPVLTPEQMPDNPYWARYREEGKTIVCMSDKTVPPMVHLIQKYLERKLITDDDCDFLNNYETKRTPGDANVNGVLMTQQNIKCANGFVHRMGEVITPLPNMADLISRNSEMTTYARLLNRFCAPYRHDDKDELTREYNRLYNTNIDTLYEKRYFSLRSQGEAKLTLTPDEGPVPDSLKYDPGWSQYYPVAPGNKSSNVAMQEDMGVMLVPSDAALERYWNEGAGKALKERYGSWDNVPDRVIVKMLNVNMLSEFTNSVPSKFKNVLNDANDELGLRTEFVDHVYMASNGAVYLTNKVFNPVAYISVTYPALVNDETMSILYWAVDQLGYDIYLNSQKSYYSLFVPTNNSMLTYIDPCSYGKTQKQIFRFHYKPEAQDASSKVWASIWNCDDEGQPTDSVREATLDEIKNRLTDILETHIVIGNVEDGHTYYRTKGGSMVKVSKASEGANGMTVQGSYQVDKNQEVAVTEVYDQSYEGNGKTYILEESPILTTPKSVADILREKPEFSSFLALLEGSDYLETKHVIGGHEYATPTENISLFNTFRYTVYVPTNASIASMHAQGLLPTWDDYEQAEDKATKDSLKAEIDNFIKYHIQDEGFYIGQQDPTSGRYETSAYSVDEETGNLSYFKLDAKVNNDELTVKDSQGNERHVTKTPGLYNLQAREYQYNSADKATATQIYTSSNIVIHQIDGVLMYKEYKKP